jgi:general secretion pathway protein F
LGEVLDQVAAYQERGARLMRAVRTALIYPAILAVAAALSVVLLLTLVVPQFEQLFLQAGQAPPLVTRVVIRASQLLRQYGWIVPLAAAAAWLLGRLRYGNVNRRSRLDRRLLRLPLAGPLIAAVSVERFARSTATLLANGVGLPDALALVGETLPNRAIGQAVAASVERVKQGERLADALEDGRALPLLAVQLIRVGEEGGRLTDMLARLSSIYAADVDVAVRRLIAIIEPALILAIGVAVGGIILSLLAAVTGVNALAL